MDKYYLALKDEYLKILSTCGISVEGKRIGVVARDISATWATVLKGAIVLYKPDSVGNLPIGFRILRIYPTETETLTLEFPMLPEDFRKAREVSDKKALPTLCGAVSGVPSSFIEEICMEAQPILA